MAENKDQIIKELRKEVSLLKQDRDEYRDMVSPAREEAKNYKDKINALIDSLWVQRSMLVGELTRCESRLRCLGVKLEK